MENKKQNEEKELEFNECPILDLKIQPIETEDKKQATILLATVQLMEWPGSTIKVLKE